MHPAVHTVVEYSCNCCDVIHAMQIAMYSNGCYGLGLTIVLQRNCQLDVGVV